MAAKKMASTSLADLKKRVPANQIKQFKAFLEKTKEYQRRVSKFPDKLPRIDWEFYRRNVRKDYVKMVEQFQIKYEELNHVFASRHDVLDFGKYYTELEKLTAEAQKDVNEFVESSNCRISVYEQEIKRLKTMMPYANMTIEQFIDEREDIAQYIPRQGKPLFWPHVPSEQRVGPAGIDYDSIEGKQAAEKVTQMPEEEPAKVAAAPTVPKTPAPTVPPKETDKKK